MCHGTMFVLFKLVIYDLHIHSGLTLFFYFLLTNNSAKETNQKFCTAYIHKIIKLYHVLYIPEKER